jgi:FKBP-type peptidyl-prolyl cis-trans isomerase 2
MSTVDAAEMQIGEVSVESNHDVSGLEVIFRASVAKKQTATAYRNF